MIKVLVVLGPTAVGKTDISLKLAKAVDGEIINGDSVQVYKELNIGSAKIKPEEMMGIKHHLLNIKNVGEPFSVYDFQKLVREKIREINDRNKLPIIVGGTGLYIQAVLYDFKFPNEIDIDLEKKYAQFSNEELHNLLKQIDIKEANKIHINNRRRVIRALEIYETHKQTKTEIIASQSKNILYDSFIVGLNMDRKKLYERINKRVDKMLENNLLTEVEQLYLAGHKVDAIGYKEFYDYFNGNKTLIEVSELIKKNTRNYAKRQLTYFRNKLPVTWYDVYNTPIEKIIGDVLNWVNK